MSYALVQSNLGDGRYRVQLDYGEKLRKDLIDANEIVMAQLTTDLDVARDAVLVAEIKEAEAKANIDILIQQLVVIANGDPFLLKETQKVLDDAQKKYAKLVAAHAPLRRQKESIKQKLADGVARRNHWTALKAQPTLDVWCTDYSDAGAIGATWATIDIPGDPTLTVLAPNYRAPFFGDGYVSNERKAGNIAQLQAQLKPLTTEYGLLQDTKLPQAVKDEAALVIVRNQAQAAFVASQTPENKAALAAAVNTLNAKRTEILAMRARMGVLDGQIKTLNIELAKWNAKSATASPNYGDGFFRLRDLGSPAQAFFNAAIYPGWQKFKPTYRWGTIRFIDYETNVANVDLGAATSDTSGERLDVNKTPQLNGVPIRYMKSDSRAFGVGDRVVIGFGNMTAQGAGEARVLKWSPTQRWEEPTLIGYLDNPRPDPPRFVGTDDPEPSYQVPDMTLHPSDGRVSLKDYLLRNGAEPLHFSVVKGELPENAALDPLTGELYAIGTSPVANGQRVVIRCEDAFYKEGNRRYDETNEFQIGISGAYLDVEGFASGGQFPPQGVPADGGTIPNGKALMYLNGWEVVFSATYNFFFLDYENGASTGSKTWREENAKVYPNYYIRRTHLGGDAVINDGVPEGTWVATVIPSSGTATQVVLYTAGYLEFGLVVQGPAKRAGYRFEIAHSPSATAILSTITATFVIAGN